MQAGLRLFLLLYYRKNCVRMRSWVGVDELKGGKRGSVRQVE